MFFLRKDYITISILCPSSSLGSLLNSVEINLFPQKWFHYIVSHFMLFPTTNKTCVLDQKQILIDNRYGHQIITLVAMSEDNFFSFCIRTKDQKNHIDTHRLIRKYSHQFLYKNFFSHKIDSDYIAPYKHIGRVDEKKKWNRQVHTSISKSGYV